LTTSSIPKNSSPIDIEWPATDMPAFEPGPTHSCPDPLDDKVPFQFSDSPDDDDDGPAERAAGIEVLAEADELDTEMIELVEHLKEVPDGSGDSVRSPDEHHLEAAAARIPEQLIETRPAGFRSRDPIGVLGDDLKTPLLSHRAKIMELSLWVLVHGRYAQIQGYSLHICSSIKAMTSSK
jgi:hypothetical protein